jgi:putative DNA primase/helicase
VITQDGVARLFASRHAGRLRFCHHTGAWFAWTGTHWRKDETDLAFQFARELGREASADANPKELKEARKVTFAAGVERFAQGDKAFAVTSEAWDRDPCLLGTPGGTVDLRTGELRPSAPEEGITKLTAVAPAAAAECPRWLSFLDEATGGDAGLIRFLKQWSGYCLTGDTREHALVFVYGPGGNGKTVFLNALTGILNGYAAVASMDTFTATRSDRHPTELAMLRGARLVTASETEEGRAWAESRIKQMTGGDPISARLMRQDFFTFQPQLKLTIVGNHKPVLRSVDEAARRRFNLVPFTRKPASPDRQLEETLRGEWPGLLRWMIEGCLDWQASGLVRPEAVQAATEAYFDDQDLFGQWLNEKCDAEPGNEYKWETVSNLFASWRAFAERAGEVAGSTKAFSERLRRAGFEPHRTPTARIFRGVRLPPTPSFHDGMDRDRCSSSPFTRTRACTRESQSEMRHDPSSVMAAGRKALAEPLC